MWGNIKMESEHRILTTELFLHLMQNMDISIATRDVMKFLSGRQEDDKQETGFILPKN